MKHYHKRTYARSSAICLACIAQARGAGVIRIDLEASTGLSKSTLSHVLQILVNQRKVAHTKASAVGEKCVNRRRYYAAEFAPPGALSGKTRTQTSEVKPKFSDVVVAPTPKCKDGWPPFFRPRFAQDKQAGAAI